MSAIALNVARTYAKVREALENFLAQIVRTHPADGDPAASQRSHELVRMDGEVQRSAPELPGSRRENVEQRLANAYDCGCHAK
jgi:hypothetical protein